MTQSIVHAAQSPPVVYQPTVLTSPFSGSGVPFVGTGTTTSVVPSTNLLSYGAPLVFPGWISTVGIRGRVVARRTDVIGTDSYWDFEGLVSGNGTNAYTWVGGAPTPAVVVQDSAASSWTVDVSIDATVLNQIDVTVTADSATVEWMVVMELVNVGGDDMTTSIVLVQSADGTSVTAYNIFTGDEMWTSPGTVADNWTGTAISPDGFQVALLQPDGVTTLVLDLSSGVTTNTVVFADGGDESTVTGVSWYDNETLLFQYSVAGFTFPPGTFT